MKVTDGNGNEKEMSQEELMDFLNKVGAFQNALNAASEGEDYPPEAVVLDFSTTLTDVNGNIQPLFVILLDKVNDLSNGNLYEAYNIKEEKAVYKLAFDIIMTGAKVDEILKKTFPDFATLSSAGTSFFASKNTTQPTQEEKMAITLLHDIQNFRQAWARYVCFYDMVFGYKEGTVANDFVNNRFDGTYKLPSIEVISGTQFSSEVIYERILDFITYAKDLLVDDLKFFDEEKDTNSINFIQQYWTQVFENLLKKLAPAFGVSEDSMLNSVGGWKDWLKRHNIQGLDVKVLTDDVKDAEFTPVSEEIVYCRYCGTKLLENAVFCHKCGKKVK